MTTPADPRERAVWQMLERACIQDNTRALASEVLAAADRVDPLRAVITSALLVDLLAHWRDEAENGHGARREGLRFAADALATVIGDQS